jgi:hypothetical protein
VAQTQVVIVYSVALGRRRTVIIPDDDSEVPIHLANILPGEAAFAGSLAQYHGIGPDAMVFAKTGHAPLSDRCIVVAPNAVPQSVAAVIRADPAIDSHPLGNIIIDVTGQAVPGLLVVNGVAVLPVFPPKHPVSSASSGKSSSSGG